MSVWQGILCGLFCSELLQRGRVTRRICNEIMRAFVVLDLAAVRLVRRIWPPRYALVGSCQRRGACCTQIIAEPPRFLLQRERLLNLFVAFHRILHNFHVTGRGPQGQLVFRCGFLQTGGRCGIYRFRPRLCRTYPLLPYFAPPQLLPGCGYRVVLRGLDGRAKLPIVNAYVGTHHVTPPRRGADDTALEHAEDFVAVALNPPGSATENPSHQTSCPDAAGGRA